MRVAQVQSRLHFPRLAFSIFAKPARTVSRSMPFVSLGYVFDSLLFNEYAVQLFG